ncbi:MAG TPA: aminotransferase class V-fold PLP-dependent enzyme [Actinomycetota bacterium]|nr:aminotransferase class V-fold PLP-dependent enzyme [Actinomycetota bacterium]
MPERPEHFPALDPDPKRIRELLEGASDLVAEFLERLPSLPVDRPRTIAETRSVAAPDFGADGIEDDELLAYLRRLLFDTSMYPGHPGFLAYIVGAGTAHGAVADLVAGAINQNVGGWRLGPGATELELHLTAWFARRFGLPEGAGGLVTSGGSMANFVALKVARDRALGLDARENGLAGARLTAYTSAEVHFATTRAADMLGLGSAAVRQIATDERFKVDVAELSARIERDRRDGFAPFAVVATAGTVGTGAVDPLDEVAELCRDQGLWMHVDAAYGGPAVLSDELRPLLHGIGRADSIAFDPHKWMYTPQSGGVVLVRDLQWLSDSFAAHATYVHEDKELTGRGIDLGMMGPQLSRSFWALKIAVSLYAYGTRAYGERIAHDAALARYLADLVEEHDELELAAPVELSICCFRYVPRDLKDAGVDDYLDALNERLMAAVQADGRVYFSNAVLRDRFVLRCCIVNFRTEAEHLERVVAVTAELGARLDQQMRPEALRG